MLYLISEVAKLKFRQYYKITDSAWGFFLGLMVPQIFFAILIIIVSSIAVSQGVEDEAITNSIALQYTSVVLSPLLFLAVFFIYSAIAKVNPINASKIKTKFNIYYLIIAVLLGTVLLFGFNKFIALCDYGIYKLTDIVPGDLPQPLDNVGMYFLGILLFAILPSVCEEFLFRGLIFNGLRTRIKPASAIILGGFLFAIMHLSIQQFIYQFVLGIVLCAVTYLTGSILYSIILHFINNFLVVTLIYANTVAGNYTSLQTTWTTTEIVLSILFMILTIVVIVLLFYFWNKKFPPKKEEVVIDNQKIVVEGIGEYEQRALNPTKMSPYGWMMLSMCVGIGMWIYSFILSI